MRLVQGLRDKEIGRDKGWRNKGDSEDNFCRGFGEALRENLGTFHNIFLCSVY